MTLVPIGSGVELDVTWFEPSGTPRGADILLTHGLASNARLWDDAATELAERGHRVVTFDQRGHGRSSKPDDGYDMATVADDLALLITELELDAPVIGGQSWGGNVVLEAAARHGGAISGAILVDGGFLHLARQFSSWDDCAEALAPPRLLGTPVSDITSWLDDMAADWPANGRTATLANFEVRTDGTIAPWLTFERHMEVLRGLWEHDPAAAYPSVDVPVFLVVATDGPEGRRRKEPLVAAATTGLASSTVEWFEPAHHDVHAQKPLEVAASIQAFCRSLSS